MKNVFLLIIVFLFSQIVFASKARLSALSSSYHISDVQTVLTNPLNLLAIEPSLSLESGVTAPTDYFDNAEATLIYALSDTKKIAVSLGHQHQFTSDGRDFINTTLGGPLTYELQQNPLFLVYAWEDSQLDVNYALAIYGSTKKDKLTNASENSSGMMFGFGIGNFLVQGDYLAQNSATSTAGTNFDGGGYARGSLIYTMASTIFYTEYELGRFKSTTADIENEKYKLEVVRVGIVDSKAKDGNDVFWGAEVISRNTYCLVNTSVGCSKVINETKLPVWWGFEYKGTDFLVIRGSIKQSILVNYKKDEMAGIEKPYAESDSAVSLGAGLNLKNILIDGTLSTATTQAINTGNLLSQVSVTYTF